MSVAIVALAATPLGGCGTAEPPATRWVIAMDGTTTVTVRAPAGHPTAFFWGAVGCVRGPGPLRIKDITLHPPASGLVVSDWGIRYRPKPRRFSDVPGAFSVGQHPLRSYGFSHAPLRTHCPKHADEFVVVLTRTGRGNGGTAGVDLHFANGSTTWLRIGMGLCPRACSMRFGDRVSDSLDR